MYQPRFQYSEKIVSLLLEIERVRSIFDFVKFPQDALLEYQFETKINRVSDGVSIDGSSLTRSQIKMLYSKTAFVQPTSETTEAKNLADAFTLLSTFVDNSQAITVESIKELHSTVVSSLVPINKAGLFRQSQLVIKDQEDPSLIYVPPPAIQIPVLIEEVCLYLSSVSAGTLHPAIKAAIVYYIFSAVHPFVEGNSSIARLMTHWVLEKDNASLHSLLSFEESMDEYLDDLLEVFFKIHSGDVRLGEHDLTGWIEAFLEMLSSAYLETRVSYEDFLSPASKLPIKVPEQIPLSPRQMKIIDYISDNGRVVMRQMRDFLPSISEDTILRDLQLLVKKGIIEKEGSTKSASYILKQ